ncbi:D-alanyl-D-alanine carboxypeptidase family protein [Macrococcoides goetzii]|uniref:M15 family metallopeptidase n=1 Tax=Macrococcus sp. PK TaxID=2801919 RepID=UPI001F0FE16B|nr:M15 family metallopeptidase [Macrococcus sp. PK]MCH4985387.1 M15 family metallopeptidase [Macrococcus sp. PK]
MKKSLLVLSAILLAACNQGETNQQTHKNSTQQTEMSSEKETTVSDATTTPSNHKKHQKEVKDGITYVDNILIVNKDIALPESYAPGEIQEARQAIDQLIQQGNAQGLNLVLRSGFRSYETQTELYNNYVARDGQSKADTYSARPGHSEHQTGLAFDLGNTAGTDDFKVSFENTAEGKWIKENAQDYGFIIRYPKGKTDITGYQYEPWHLRYLGKEIAQKVKSSGLTLEEYLDLK